MMITFIIAISGLLFAWTILLVAQHVLKIGDKDAIGNLAYLIIGVLVVTAFVTGWSCGRFDNHRGQDEKVFTP